MLNATSDDIRRLIENLQLTEGATVMTIWAHPDDESFLAGGLMIAAAARGARVLNVTATLGELGTDDPDRWTPTRLRDRRRLELAEALALLGGAELETLGVSDGSCDRVHDRMGARLVTPLLERHRPDVIVTFGPDGVTGHPDHQAVGRWTDLAAAGYDRSIPVLHVATAAAWPAELIERMHRSNAFFPGYPERTRHRTDHHLVLDDEMLDRKLAALDCHRSQIGPLRDQLGPCGYRELFRHEAYRPANAAALGRTPTPSKLAPVA